VLFVWLLMTLGSLSQSDVFQDFVKEKEGGISLKSQDQVLEVVSSFIYCVFLIFVVSLCVEFCFFIIRLILVFLFFLTFHFLFLFFSSICFFLCQSFCLVFICIFCSLYFLPQKFFLFLFVFLCFPAVRTSSRKFIHPPCHHESFFSSCSQVRLDVSFSRCEIV